MTELRYRTTPPVLSWVSKQAPCRGKAEYGEKKWQTFHTVTWQLISSACDAKRHAEQPYECQWEDTQDRSTISCKKKRWLDRQKAQFPNLMCGLTCHVMMVKDKIVFHLVSIPGWSYGPRCNQVFDFKCSSHEKGRLKTHPSCLWPGAVTQLPELNLNLKTDS